MGIAYIYTYMDMGTKGVSLVPPTGHLLRRPVISLLLNPTDIITLVLWVFPTASTRLHCKKALFSFYSDRMILSCYTTWNIICQWKPKINSWVQTCSVSSYLLMPLPGYPKGTSFSVSALYQTHGHVAAYPHLLLPLPSIQLHKPQSFPCYHIDMYTYLCV